MNKFESRYFNTATTMDEALIEMLKRKEYKYITVTDICERAGVNRSTFYLHYEKMDDLLQETIIYVNNSFDKKFASTKIITQKKSMDLKDKVLISKDYLIPYLKYIKENSFIFKCTHDNPDLFDSNKVFDTFNNDIFTPIMNDFRIPKDEQKYFVEYYSKGILAIIFKWISLDFQEPVEKIYDMIIKCTRIDMDSIDIYK